MGSNETVNEEQETTITLPSHLVSRIENRLPRTTFDTPDEYVTYVLEEVLVRVEAETDDDAATVTEGEVERRLESLGYLDR